MHRSHLTAVAAVVGHSDRNDHASSAVSGELHVVRRTKATISHLHVPSFGIGGRTTSLVARTLLPLFLLLLKFGEVLQGCFHPLLPFCGRALGSRTASCVAGIAGGILRVLFAKLLHLGGCFLATVFQSLPATKRSAPRMGSNAHAILSHRLQGHDVLVEQRGDGIRQQFVQEFSVVGAKVAEQVVVHADFPTDPQVGQVAFAKPSQVTGAADPFDDGEHPQRHQDLRIDRG